MRQERANPLTIDVEGGRTVSARWAEPAVGTDAGWIFVYAPGASSNLQDPFGRFVSGRFAERGIGTLSFQFPYMEQRRAGPDRPPVLEATWRAAIAVARQLTELSPPPVGDESPPLVGPSHKLAVGGRSMGGRVASLIVAAGERVDALVLFAYPLHPPRRPDQTRDAHLGSIAVPTLFCSGTRDAFGTPEELRAACGLVPAASLHLLDDADHGYAVLRASSRTREQVWSEAAETALDWLLAL